MSRRAQLKTRKGSAEEKDEERDDTKRTAEAAEEMKVEAAHENAEERNRLVKQMRKRRK